MPVSGIIITSVAGCADAVAARIATVEGVEIHGVLPDGQIVASNGEYCLGCHKTGLKGAALCPHPVRLSCTGCHAQGEIKKAKKNK